MIKEGAGRRRRTGRGGGGRRKVMEGGVRRGEMRWRRWRVGEIRRAVGGEEVEGKWIGERGVRDK